MELNSRPTLKKINLETIQRLIMGAVSAPILPAYRYALIPCVQAYFNDVMAGRYADVELKARCNRITSLNVDDEGDKLVLNAVVSS